MLSTPYHISSVLILNLSCYINRCFKWDLFASILTTTVYAHHIPSMQATCPNHLFLLDFKILITHCEVYSSLICSFLVPSVTASLLVPYNFLSTLSQARSVCRLVTRRFAFQVPVDQFSFLLQNFQTCAGFLLISDTMNTETFPRR